MGSCCQFIMKSFVTIVGIGLIVLGVVIVIVVGSQVDKLTDYIPSEKADDYKKVASYIIMAFGAILILQGLAGIFGACKNSKCLLRFFNSIVIFLAIIFLIIGIFCLVAFKKIKDDIDCKGDKGFLDDADELVNKAGKYFCPEATCCPSVLNQQDEAVIRVQQCDHFDEELGDDHSNYLIKTMKKVEEHFECSGICTQYDYYIFSDALESVKPKGNCVDQIKDEFSDIANLLGISCTAIGSILLLTAIFACCLGKKKDKKDQYK